MRSAMRRAIACIFVACLAFVTGTAASPSAQTQLPYYDSADFTPRWLTPDSPKLTDFHRIPDFRFTNQDGREISSEDVAGRIYVASFFFSTCPGICPKIRSKLSQVQTRFIDDDDVTILSHSIRPTTDTPAILQAFASANGIQSHKWHLLTGDKDAIYSLAKEAYFANEDLGETRNSNDFLHTENLLLIDSDRRIRGVYNGLSASSVSHLMADIELLKRELTGDT